MEYLLDLLKRFPVPASFSGLNSSQQFYQQKTIVPFGNYSLQSVIPLAPEVDFDMMPLPKGPLGKGPATDTRMNMVVMPKTAKRKDLGWLFMAYYAGKETIAKRLPIAKRMGLRKDFFESNEWKTEIKQTPALEQAPKVTALGGARPFVLCDEVNTAAGPIFQKISRGEIGVREGLAEAEREANRILSQAPR